MENMIYNILNDMSEVLNIQQMRKLQETLIKRLQDECDLEYQELDNFDYLEMFVAAKKIEGCSERTIEYYQSTISNMLKQINIPLRKVTTEVLREYLTSYQMINGCSKVTIDNIRRNLSSFFLGWKMKIIF